MQIRYYNFEILRTINDFGKEIVCMDILTYQFMSWLYNAVFINEGNQTIETKVTRT
jgi:hypothetical protein